MKSPANETFSRWLCQGIPLVIGVGIVAGFALHFSFGLQLSNLAVPIAVLLGIQVVFYLSMYPVRERYRQIRNPRMAAIVTGIYGFSIVLVGMYYVGQLGIANAKSFKDNYVGFSVFMGVVMCTVIVIFSLVKPKPNS